MSNTPDTDANQIFLGLNPDEGDYFVPAEIARQLEQQRDRLAEAIRKHRDELELTSGDSVDRILWNAIEVVEGGSDE